MKSCLNLPMDVFGRLHGLELSPDLNNLDPFSVEARALQSIQSFPLGEVQQALRIMDSSPLGRRGVQEGASFALIRKALVEKLAIIL